MEGAPLAPLLEVAILLPPVVVSCFLVADAVRRAPLLRRVL